MNRLPLSNLQVRPHLLAEDYQQEMLHCTISELRDIERRNSGLVHLSPARRKEVQAALFWGTAPPPPLDPRWAEPLAAGMADALSALEEQPTLEAAFECLVLARGFYHSRAAGPGRVAAAEWDRRVCVVLARDEFRYTREMTDQRLDSILGRATANPTPPAPPSPPKPPAPPRPPAVMKPKLVPASSVFAVPPPSKPEAPPPAAVPAAPRAPFVVKDPDLKRLVHAWDGLPDHVKKCVVLLLDAAEVAAKSPTP